MLIYFIFFPNPKDRKTLLPVLKEFVKPRSNAQKNKPWGLYQTLRLSCVSSPQGVWNSDKVRPQDVYTSTIIPRKDVGRSTLALDRAGWIIDCVAFEIKSDYSKNLYTEHMPPVFAIWKNSIVFPVFMHIVPRKCPS